MGQSPQILGSTPRENVFLGLHYDMMQKVDPCFFFYVGLGAHLYVRLQSSLIILKHCGFECSLGRKLFLN
jgi:hypothetical protein